MNTVLPGYLYDIFHDGKKNSTPIPTATIEETPAAHALTVVNMYIDCFANRHDETFILGIINKNQELYAPIFTPLFEYETKRDAKIYEVLTDFFSIIARVNCLCYYIGGPQTPVEKAKANAEYLGVPFEGFVSKYSKPTPENKDPAILAAREELYNEQFLYDALTKAVDNVIKNGHV